MAFLRRCSLFFRPGTFSSLGFSFCKTQSKVTQKESFSNVSWVSYYSSEESKDFKENYQPDAKKNFEDYDFLNSLDKISSFSELYGLLLGTPVHLIQAHLVFLKMSKLYQTSDFRDRRKNEFFKSDPYFTLCGLLDKSLPTVTPSVLPLLVEACGAMGLPADSLIVKKILILTLDNINEFDVWDKIKLISFLSSNDLKLTQEGNNLLLAVLTSLTHFTDNLPVILKDPKNLASLAYHSQKYMPQSLRTKFLEEILRTNLNDVSTHTLLHILNALRKASVGFELEQSLLEAIKYKLREGDLREPTFYWLIVSYLAAVRKGRFPYDGDFCDLIVNSITQEQANVTQDERLGIQRRLFILADLCLMGHLDRSLLDKVLEDVKRLGVENLSSDQIRALLMIFSAISFKEWPEYKSDWEEFKKVLKTVEVKLSEKKPVCLVTDLVLLGITEKLTDDVIRSLVSKLKRRGSKGFAHPEVRDIFLLHQYLSMSSSEIESFPQDILSDLAKFLRRASTDFHFFDALVEIFGGSEFILKNCKTSLWHLMTYGVVLRPDNTPVSIENYKCARDSDGYINIEDIARQIPEGKAVVIDEANFSVAETFINCPVKRARGKIVRESLRKLGITPVLINAQHFFNRPAEERTKFLKEEISSEIGPFGNSPI